MRDTRNTVLLLVLLCLGNIYAHPIPSNPVLSLYSLHSSDDGLMRSVARRWEVKSKEGNQFKVIVPKPEALQFLAIAPKAQLIEPDMAAALRKKVGADRAGWRNLQGVHAELDKIADDYPMIATVDTYGKSMEGRALKVLRLQGKTPLSQRAPAVAITSATHGDELITVEVVMELLQEMVSKYGTDTRITRMIDSHEIFFIPVVNPDGYVRMERYSNGVDPNRDYPWPESPNRNPNPAIKAIMDFFASHDVKGSLDYHSTGGMIMYPWAYTHQSLHQEDKEKFAEITRNMASTNGYRHGPIADVIYVAKGSSADYYYWKLKTTSLAIEIRRDGSASLIPEMTRENRESTWQFIESITPDR